MGLLSVAGDLIEKTSHYNRLFFFLLFKTLYDFSPASNIRVAGRGQIKHVGLILNKNTQPIEFTNKLVLQL